MYQGTCVVEKKTIPLIPLRGITVFPQMIIHFDVGRDKSIKALEEAMVDNSEIMLCTQKNASQEDPTEEDFYHVGTVARIKQMIKLPLGSVRVLVEGLNRGKVLNFIENDKYIEAEIEEYIIEDFKDSEETLALKRLLIDDFEEYIAFSNKIGSDALMKISDVEDADILSNLVSSYISLKSEEYQDILEAIEIEERLELIHMYIQQEIELLKIEEKISRRVKKQMNEVQKEYYLKEQLRAIQKELGDDGGIQSDLEDYRNRLDSMDLPEEVREKAYKELDRLEKMMPQSAETQVLRTYLDWITELPWDKATVDRVDISNARKVLDEDHYGLKDVKERILEFIAVRELTKDMDSAKGSILCLVGPPGVGKTSIAKSVARALEKNFVRMSLGGVRDEAEIRGHRKTYVGAMPGRIISSLKKADSNNPVFLLDEIDKMASDFRGDPASALLEVLDPEQNDSFTDHFLELPFDLSQVFFLTTANSLSTIPGPLLDRMEVIEISSYTQEEKFKIAKRYLLPKRLKENGLTEENLQISDNVIEMIIRNYTREAGVRNLEREIGKVCRKAAKRIVEEDIDVVRVNKGNLDKYLGVERFPDSDQLKNEVGVATGLAWTQVGGEILSIEVNTMKGKGKVQLTGKLGDVMKESALAGISYIRAHAKELGIDEDFHEKLDIHIHVPEGAIPKDGPSAGVTMTTACVSALSGKKVIDGLAMTGEITLRGNVLPVGGIKEKVLAANRMGIKKLVLPKANKKDLVEIPENIRRGLDISLVNHISEVLDQAIIEGEEKDENK